MSRECCHRQGRHSPGRLRITVVPSSLLRSQWSSAMPVREERAWVGEEGDGSLCNPPDGPAPSIVARFPFTARLPNLTCLAAAALGCHLVARSSEALLVLTLIFQRLNANAALMAALKLVFCGPTARSSLTPDRKPSVSPPSKHRYFERSRKTEVQAILSQSVLTGLLTFELLGYDLRCTDAPRMSLPRPRFPCPGFGVSEQHNWLSRSISRI